MELKKLRLALCAGVAALALFAGAPIGPASAQIQSNDSVQPPKYEIEKGATLRVLRPAKFVQGDETLFLENTKKFTEKTGVPVRVDSESWEDLRPKTAVAANVGSGPDIVLAWNDDPQNYSDKLLDVSDLGKYLGEKYGGWYPVAQRYGQKDGKWISLPIGASGGTMVYRKSWLEKAGFKEFPKDFDSFLKMCQALAKDKHYCGFALGNAVGDGNSWTHWVLWGHGGKLVDEKNKVVLNSPETIKALNYAKQLCETFIPGTASWLDPSNNKAFLSGEIGVTANGISIYYAAKTSNDPEVKKMADDIYHQRFPVGPVGEATETGLLVNPMIFKYTKYPNAAKEYLRFMFEKEQYGPWQEASIGYWSHPLRAYEGNPIWKADPKHEPYSNVIDKMKWYGYAGELGEASAATLADFIVPNMFTKVCTGQATPEQAAAEGHKRAERYYRS